MSQGFQFLVTDVNGHSTWYAGAVDGWLLDAWWVEQKPWTGLPPQWWSEFPIEVQDAIHEILGLPDRPVQVWENPEVEAKIAAYLAGDYEGGSGSSHYVPGETTIPAGEGDLEPAVVCEDLITFLRGTWLQAVGISAFNQAVLDNYTDFLKAHLRTVLAGKDAWIAAFPGIPGAAGAAWRHAMDAFFLQVWRYGIEDVKWAQEGRAAFKARNEDLPDIADLDCFLPEEPTTGESGWLDIKCCKTCPKKTFVWQTNDEKREAMYLAYKWRGVGNGEYAAKESLTDSDWLAIGKLANELDANGWPIGQRWCYIFGSDYAKTHFTSNLGTKKDPDWLRRQIVDEYFDKPCEPSDNEEKLSPPKSTKPAAAPKPCANAGKLVVFSIFAGGGSGSAEHLRLLEKLAQGKKLVWYPKIPTSADELVAKTSGAMGVLFICHGGVLGLANTEEKPDLTADMIKEASRKNYTVPTKWAIGACCQITEQNGYRPATDIARAILALDAGLDLWAAEGSQGTDKNASVNWVAGFLGDFLKPDGELSGSPFGVSVEKGNAKVAGMTGLTYAEKLRYVKRDSDR